MLGSPSVSARYLLDVLVDEPIIEAIDSAAPMDGVSIDHAHRALAAAFTLRADGEAALREHYELKPEGALTKLVAKDRERAADGVRLPRCALSAARLVCAHDEDTLQATAPYLVTTLGAEPLEHDARVTLPGATIRNRVHEQAHPAEDRLVIDLVAGLEREIDRIDLDFDLGANVESIMTMRLLSRDAPLTRALVPAGRTGPPPADFSRLPSDATLTLFSNGAAAEDLAPLKKTIIDDLQASLESDGYAPAAARASLDELAALFLTGGPFVLAAGVNGGDAAAIGALPLAKMRAALAPWIVAGVPEPAKRWIDGLRALVKKNEEAERSRKKPASPLATRRPDSDDLAVRIVPVTAATKLPLDSLHVELRFTPKQKNAGGARVAHLWVVPHAEHTWLGYGEDEAGVRERLRAATDDAHPSKAAPKNMTPGLIGGSATTSALALLFARRHDDDQVEAAHARARKIATLPGRGDTPFIASMTTNDRRLVVRLRGSKDAAVEIASTFF